VGQNLPSTSGELVVPKFLLPSWILSVLVHAGLVLLLTTVTWTVSRQRPDENFTVGIMVRKDTPEGQVFESQDTTYVAQQDPSAQSEKFLPDMEPAAVAQSLPKLPEVDLSAIGISGSMLSGPGDLLSVPNGAAASGAMVNTQFFGAQVWGSRFVYVIDRSGSMSQRERLEAAKSELMNGLEKLPAETQFQIIFYNFQPDIVVMPKPPKLHFASESNKKLAAIGMGKIIPDGGTEHLPALKLALSLKPDVIFFLTDADDLRARDVKEATDLNRDQARIHTIEFGIGAEVDRENQLRELAVRNGGTYRYIDAAKLDRRGEGNER